MPTQRSVNMCPAADSRLACFAKQCIHLRSKENYNEISKQWRPQFRKKVELEAFLHFPLLKEKQLEHCAIFVIVYPFRIIVNNFLPVIKTLAQCTSSMNPSFHIRGFGKQESVDEYGTTSASPHIFHCENHFFTLMVRRKKMQLTYIFHVLWKTYLK